MMIQDRDIVYITSDRLEKRCYSTIKIVHSLIVKLNADPSVSGHSPRGAEGWAWWADFYFRLSLIDCHTETYTNKSNGSVNGWLSISLVAKGETYLVFRNRKKTGGLLLYIYSMYSELPTC